MGRVKRERCRERGRVEEVARQIVPFQAHLKRLKESKRKRRRKKRSLSNLCDSSARIRVEYLRRRRVRERERDQFCYIAK